MRSDELDTLSGWKIVRHPEHYLHQIRVWHRSEVLRKHLKHLIVAGDQSHHYSGRILTRIQFQVSDEQHHARVSIKSSSGKCLKNGNYRGRQASSAAGLSLHALAGQTRFDVDLFPQRVVCVIRERLRRQLERDRNRLPAKET